MRKNNPILIIKNTYFDENLELHVQSFNLLGFAGILACTAVAMASYLQKAYFNAIVCFICLCAAFFLLRVTGKGIAGLKFSYRLSSWMVVVAVFMVAFPALYFSSGGNNGGMLCFFIFAIIFTTILLSKYERTAALITLFILYAGCCIIAYYFPETLSPVETEHFYLIEALVGVLICGSLLMFVVLLQIRIYRNRQEQIRKLNRELEARNAQLDSLNRIKTEFLQDIKHEVRNPLHVISLGADFVHDRIDADYGAEEAHKALNAMQNEAVRLGRMINGVVEMATMSGYATNRERVDFAELLRNCCDASRLQTEQNNTMLRINIPTGLPYVYAEAEQLVRVPVNLLSNAVNATQNGEITLDASAESNYITVIIRDTGEGISPELLPHVFERGVSGQGGKGYGLSIGKTIVEAHGGTIIIENGKLGGAVVTFTVPVYGGQEAGHTQ